MVEYHISQSIPGFDFAHTLSELARKGWILQGPVVPVVAGKEATLIATMYRHVPTGTPDNLESTDLPVTI